MKISEFETKVLRRIKRTGHVAGNKMIAITAAARRLEKKGLAFKSYNWYITSAGEAYLEALEKV